MIYLVTRKQELFEDPDYTIITAERAIEVMQDWKLIQYDSETGGRNPRLCKLLCAQFGNDAANTRIVVDCETVDIKLFKDILESKLLVGHNLKFDLQFLYNYSIVPRRVYDTMIVEQFLYLGYPREVNSPYRVSFALNEVARRRLQISIDKTVRGEIIWRGLDKAVIIYGAGDVTYLEQIMWSQVKDCKERGGLKGAKIECDFVPAIAYLEWCGIKLDENRWREKMRKDKENLDKRKKALDDFLIKNSLSKYYHIDTQGDLFNGFSTEPVIDLNWASSKQVIKLAKDLGFDTTVQDKKTGEDKDSVLEKHLKTQKGVNDEFLSLYFDYKESEKVVSSFGQGHLNLINPLTGRLHTSYWQIGTSSGRMSSGSGVDTDLAAYKHIPASQCKMVNMQQLPHDAETRACFVAEKGNLFCSCDYSAMEARIGAEVYDEKMLLDEFLYGSGDTHAAYAKVVFADELKDIDVKDIKAKRPDLRNKVKSVEFAVQFGSDGTAVAPQLGISEEEARQLVSNLLSGMKGLARFKNEGSKKVRASGYVTALEQTGHKVYWASWKDWVKESENWDSDFWDNYKTYHKGTGDKVALQVKQHFKEASKWDRLALNIPTQAGGAVVLKTAVINLFNWIIDNGYFNKILLVNFTHDEINSEFPKELKDSYPKLVAQIMKDAAAIYYHKLPIPAEAEVDTCWRH